jgi:hypothetical protein
MKCGVMGCRRKATIVYITTVSHRAFHRCATCTKRNIRDLKSNGRQYFKSERSLKSYVRGIYSRLGIVGDSKWARREFMSVFEGAKR